MAAAVKTIAAAEAARV